MKKLLLAAGLLVGCMTESENSTDSWPKNKKEVPCSTSSNETVYLPLSPKPERWEAYRTDYLGQDTVKAPVLVNWQNNGKGLELRCTELSIKWEIWY